MFLIKNFSSFKKSYIWLISIFTLAVTALNPLFAMEISTEFNGGNCEGCEWVQLDGNIVKGDADKFESFVKTNNIKAHQFHNIVYLNSLGGSLAEGIKLGRLLRKFGFTTAIAKTVPDGVGENTGVVQQEDASCISACAYAFLGGRFRRLSLDAKNMCLGFHQFYNPNFQSGNASAADLAQTSTQKIGGIVIEYLNEIESDARLYSFASRFVGTDVGCVGEEENRKFGLDNTVEYFSDLELHPFGKGLIAEVKAPLRDRKIRLYCTLKSAHIAFFLEASFFNFMPERDSGVSLAVATTSGKLPLLINTQVVTKDKKHFILVADVPSNFVVNVSEAGKVWMYGDYPRSMNWIGNEFSFDIAGDKRIVDFALQNCIG